MSSGTEDFYTEVYSLISESRCDYTYVRYSEDCISFIEATIYLGEDNDECYGMILDRESSDKLIGLIKKDGQTIEEAVKEHYTGTNILSPVESFLMENGIHYRWSGSKHELGW